MRSVPTITLLLPLCAAILPAQEPSGQQLTTPPPDAAKQELQSLRKEIGKAQQEAIKAYQDAVAARKAAIERGEADANAPMPAFAMDKVIADFVPKYRAAAERYQGTDAALPFLLFLVGNDDEHNDAVLATLMHDHLHSAEFGQVVDMLRFQTRRLGDEKVREMLDTVLAENEHPDVQAAAHLARAQMVLDRDEPATADQKSAALDDLRQAVKLAESHDVKSRAEGVLFAQEHLQVGMLAPDIVGTDLEGQPLKLSDSRGKVVLLDFWGDW